MVKDTQRTKSGPPTSNVFDCRNAAQSHLEAGNVTSAGILERAADEIESLQAEVEHWKKGAQAQPFFFLSGVILGVCLGLTF